MKPEVVAKELEEAISRARRGDGPQYRAADPGKRKKLSGFFVGQIMKLSKGQANPQMVSQLLLAQLEKND